MRYLLIIILLTTLVCGCKKDNDPYIGEANAIKNGVHWEAETKVNTLGSNSGKIDIQMFAHRESFTIHNISPEIGKFPIDTISGGLLLINLGATFVTIVDDGDVIGDEYYSPASNPENYIIVEAYDSLSGEIRGKFNAYVVLQPDWTKFDPSLPDTMRFENGKFNAVIKK